MKIKNMKVKDTKLLIVLVFLINLSIYIFLYPKLINNIDLENRFYLKFKAYDIVIKYNPIYVNLYYIILSSYLMLDALNFRINKLLRFVIWGTVIALAFTSYYKYRPHVGYGEMMYMATLLLFFNVAIYRHLLNIKEKN
ncbi:MAG: hypothetical protein ACRDA4_10085 [Filifactoraceae bacterium]